MQRGEQSVDVVIETLVFRGGDGFAVVKASRLLPSPGDRQLTLVGALGSVAPGESLRVQGRFVNHATYGWRFRVGGFVPIVPTTEIGIARFLGSGLIEGVGPSLAERLVRHFGDQTLEIIATQSKRLREVPGIGAKRANAISSAVRARRADAEILAFLRGLAIGPAAAAKIVERYGEAAAKQVRDDPYLVAEQIRGIGFRTADDIGRKVGIAGRRSPPGGGRGPSPAGSGCRRRPRLSDRRGPRRGGR